jgi:hypothetical protein
MQKLLPREEGGTLTRKQISGRVIHIVIPSEARNLSLAFHEGTERFLGAQRASE